MILKDMIFHVSFEYHPDSFADELIITTFLFSTTLSMSHHCFSARQRSNMEKIPHFFDRAKSFIVAAFVYNGNNLTDELYKAKLLKLDARNRSIWAE